MSAACATVTVQRTIARKVADFVAMIRSLSLARNEKGLYDFGLEIATRSGILAAYRAENTPEATSALDNIEELLNSMQEFKERCDAEIRMLLVEGRCQGYGLFLLGQLGFNYIVYQINSPSAFTFTFTSNSPFSSSTR